MVCGVSANAVIPGSTAYLSFFISMLIYSAICLTHVCPVTVTAGIFYTLGVQGGFCPWSLSSVSHCSI